METIRAVHFQDLLPVIEENIGGEEGFITELYNGFKLLMDAEKGVITFDSLKWNSALLGLGDMKDDELECMVREGDLDGDGALNKLEFCSLMCRLSPQLMDEADRLLVLTRPRFLGKYKQE